MLSSIKWVVIHDLFMNHLNQLWYNSLFYIQILFITATQICRKQLKDFGDIKGLITRAILWFDPTS